jgi:hypothetical protein
MNIVVSLQYKHGKNEIENAKQAEQEWFDKDEFGEISGEDKFKFIIQEEL